jgi:hypothetical protein
MRDHRVGAGFYRNQTPNPLNISYDEVLTQERTMKAVELISMLQDLVDNAGEKGEEVEVRWASQPHWPFEYDIGDPVVVGENDGKLEDFEEAKATGGLTDEELEEGQAAADEMEANNTFVIYLPEGRQIGYLPGVASNALGWR